MLLAPQVPESLALAVDAVPLWQVTQCVQWSAWLPRAAGATLRPCHLLIPGRCLDCAAYKCAAHLLDPQCLSLESDITSLTSIILSPSYYAYQVSDCSPCLIKPRH